MVYLFRTGVFDKLFLRFSKSINSIRSPNYRTISPIIVMERPRDLQKANTDEGQTERSGSTDNLSKRLSDQEDSWGVVKKCDRSLTQRTPTPCVARSLTTFRSLYRVVEDRGGNVAKIRATTRPWSHFVAFVRII